MPTATATKTVDPHRFEDLIRQLIYGYCFWGSVEAVERLGSDEGINIRAVEMAGSLIGSLPPSGCGEALGMIMPVTWIQQKWNARNVRRTNRELMLDPERLEEVTYHEAGHAVIACLLDFDVQSVTILCDPSYLKPGVAILISEQMDQRSTREKAFALAIAERWIAQSMAGRLTATIKTGKELFDSSRTDRSVELALAEKLGIYHSLDMIKKNTSRLLSEPSVWNAITEVAQALSSRYRLSGDEVCKIVAEHRSEMPAVSEYFYFVMPN